MSEQAADCRPWIGRSETDEDVALRAPALRLAATLDRADLIAKLQARDATLPPCWHWLYFLPRSPQSTLGPDGHPQRSGFLPPVALPRRMWAGSRVDFRAPIAFGAALARTSTIADVRNTSGRSGALAIVTVRHEIRADGALAIVDEHDIVYREAPAHGEPAAARRASASRAAQFGRPVAPDPVLLFRYSALTFNGHRIHYDRSYATAVEGYPGLVVHGPLQATLLLDLLDRELPGARPSRFAFRALAPLFDTAPFDVCGARDGDRVRLWTQSADGAIALDATVELA
ncbi:MAG: MaoC family dehydratase N-terminal domain-containing protein [Burkholderiaceae bacterium]|nr:MaoC family dehydratase N-terminal domain-containing protein [Burkholderiaceae bacterium]